MVEFQGADDFFTTVAEGGGKAYRFTDIDGIGPATADKITSIRGVQNPEDVADMSADELSDKAGISHSRATKAIKGGGGNPNVSKESNTGTVSAAGITKRQGDFWVEYTEMDNARARNDTQSRSEEAVRTDDRKRAPVTTDYEKWKQNPGIWDFPGVDTPTNEPNLLPKDVKKGDPNTADFDESGEAEFDEQEEDTFPRVVDSPSGIEILETGDDRVPATDVTRSVPNPDTFAPGIAPEDFEENEAEPGPDVMGPEPSSQRLPETARQNLASGESADISFVQAEQSRSGQEAETGTAREEYNLSDTTLAQLRTALNKRTDDYFDIYDPAKADRFESIRQRISIGDSIELDYDEYRMVERVLREEKEDAEDRAERMDRNIYGDTDEQAERAKGAFRDLRNNPPSNFY